MTPSTPPTPPWETDERATRRASYDEDPDTYDRTRPVAPAHVFDDLVRLAGLRPGSAVVEIGPGTGQATRPLAERGLRVVAVELGKGLAARARRNLAAFPDVEVITAAFEAWEPGEARFDAVVSCNAFHWVDPAIGFDKSAALLRPGGHLILLSTPWVVPDDADRFWWDIQDDWAAVGGGRIDPATAHPDRIGGRWSAVGDSGLFEAPAVRRSLFAVTFSADEYAANLSTQAAAKALAPTARAELVDRVRRRALAGGGTVTGHLLAVLSVARVRSVAP